MSLDRCPSCDRLIRDFDSDGVEYGTGQRACLQHAERTHEHHPLCDDNGWDHWGPCIVETDFYDDAGNMIHAPDCKCSNCYIPRV